MSKLKAIRYHDFSAGHRVANHESCCKHLHGHNYRIYFHCGALQLDALGRVIDFGEIKTRLCEWLEVHWDHKFLMWVNDPLLQAISAVDGGESLVVTDFNPTAENMGLYLLEEVGPLMLKGTGIVLEKVVVEETRKCSAEVSLGGCCGK